ncbi:MAG: peptidoglycan DD-metalloendopeptidase family protein [Nitrospirae bacterium]|nr:peptidoglycan DD-metalloendopeptidase family protein [Nitrospirota bacterium]
MHVQTNTSLVKKNIPLKKELDLLKGNISARNFKRYRKQAEAVVRFLNLNTGAYKGKIVDWSDGACVIIEDDLSLESSTLVDIKNQDSGISLLGEVIWTEKLANGLKAGVKRVDNLRGSLKDFRLADVLIGLHKSKGTGILEINNGAIQKNIYIKNGDIIFASSNLVDDHLVEILLNGGRITREQYDKAVEVMEKTGKSYETILVELDYLTPQELLEALKCQVEGIVMGLFTVEDGNFEFQEGPFSTDEVMVIFNLNTTINLIYLGIKRINYSEYVREREHSMDTVLSLSQDSATLLRDLSLDDTDKRILLFINGRNSIRKILSLSPLGMFETLKTIYALQTIGVIEITEENEVLPEPPHEEIISERKVEPIMPLRALSPSPSQEEIISEHDPEIDKELVEKVEDLHRKYKTIEYRSSKPFSRKILFVGIILSVAIWILIVLAYVAVSASEQRKMKEKLSYYSEKFSELQVTMEALNKAESEFRRIFSLGTKEKVLESIHTSANDSIDMEVLKEQISNTIATVEGIKEYLSQQRDIYMATPKGWPVIGRVTSPYGKRKHPVHGGDDFHSGVDIAVTPGTPMMATADGIVSFAGWSGNSGNLVVLEHGFDYSTAYAHARRIDVKVGQLVKRGDIIAYAGSTGNSTGSHCHYEIWKDGNRVNPMPFIEGEGT